MTLKVKTFTYLDKQNTQYALTNVPVLLYAVTLLIFQIKTIISSEKWFNYVITFFFKCTKFGPVR